MKDRGELDFVMSFVESSQKYKDQFVAKWQEILASFLVQPDYAKDGSSTSPYERRGETYQRRKAYGIRDSIILKDPQTHQVVMTYAAKIVKAIFGDNKREFVQARPVGWEDAQVKVRKISPAGKAHIQKWEGLRLNAYLCPAGVWTIGYGSTRLNGRPVQKGDRITREQAQAMLNTEIEEKITDIYRMMPVTNINRLSPGMWDALISATYNLGAGTVRYGSRAGAAKKQGTGSIYAAAMANSPQAMATALRRYVMGGGKVLPGLQRRRAEEARMAVAPAPAQPVVPDVPAPEPASLAAEQALPGRPVPEPAILVNSANEKSILARDRVERVLHRWRQSIVSETLRQRNIPAAVVEPFQLARTDVARESSRRAAVWSWSTRPGPAPRGSIRISPGREITSSPPRRGL